MIDKTFWEKVALSWVREDDTEIPEINVDPEEDMDGILEWINDEILDVDDLLKELI